MKHGPCANQIISLLSTSHHLGQLHSWDQGLSKTLACGETLQKHSRVNQHYTKRRREKQKLEKEREKRGQCVAALEQYSNETDIA